MADTGGAARQPESGRLHQLSRAHICNCPVKARYYRLFFNGTQASPHMRDKEKKKEPNPVELSEVEFLAAPRVNRWEDKASFGIYAPGTDTAAEEVKPGEAIDPAKVIDLTGKMRPDGTLDWDAPAGKWIVMRLGYSLTGEVNHPATPAATGLEVDKLSKKDVQAYVEEYVKMISETTGPYWGKSFKSFLMDSWEAGQENWTEEMMQEFKTRRGYEMTKYLPVLTGRLVGSRAESEAFPVGYAPHPGGHAGGKPLRRGDQIFQSASAWACMPKRWESGCRPRATDC
jgi:hypothetical protein